MNFNPIKRPRAQDSEEEILQMQEEFLKNNLPPSAKLINLKSKNNESQKESTNIKTDPPKKMSKFALKRKDEAEKKRSIANQISGNIINPNTVNLDKTLESDKFDPINNFNLLPTNIILGNIVERDIENCSLNMDKSENYPDTAEGGFPLVFESDTKKTNEKKAQSIFLQSISNKLQNNKFEGLAKSVDSNNITDSSCVVTGAWANEIHNENVEKIQSMCQEQILQEQKELQSIVDPKIIAFLKSKRNQIKMHNINSTEQERIKYYETNKMQGTISVSEPAENLNKDRNIESSKHELMEISDSSTLQHQKSIITDNEIPEPVVSIVNEAEKSGWIHMDAIESEKMKWMENVDSKESNNCSEESYNARFDFNGLLLPYNDEKITVYDGLHHHGEEPARPGYSLQELLQLSRSANQQQRCTSLSTLAKIIEHTHNGFYDQALEPPLLTTLSEKNVLLLLRFSLDDTSIAVIEASLQAMRALIFNRLDELCLDRIFSTINFEEPVLKPKIQDIDKVDALKDHELAQFDTIAALLRTDIIYRLRFLLREKSLSSGGLIAVIEILTRLARYSSDTALRIGSFQNLLESISEKCLPLTLNTSSDSSKKSNEVSEITAALKLFRILITYGGNTLMHRIIDLNITHRFISYLTSDATGNQPKVHIESLRLWRLLLQYGLDVFTVIEIRSVLIFQLVKFGSNLDLETVSPLRYDYAFNLISLSKYDPHLKQYVSPLMKKWSTQLERMKLITWNQSMLLSQTIQILNDVDLFCINWIEKSKLLGNISPSDYSNLISGLNSYKTRYPSSLPNLCVITTEGNLQPIVGEKSPIIFLRSVLEFFILNNRKQEICFIMRREGIIKYLHKLQESDWVLERSWFTRLEYGFLITLIKADKQIGFSSEIRKMLKSIAVKLISSLPADNNQDVKFCIQYVFNSELDVPQLQVALQNLTLDNSHFEEKIDKNLNEKGILLYESFVNRKGEWTEAALPKDWAFLPLVESYTRLRNEAKWNENWTEKIIIMLNSILIYPEVVESLTPAMRFSRLVLLYLCDTAFLYPAERSKLPSALMANLVTKNYKKFDFSTPIPGLTSFNDLFTALCEHFVAHSYNEHSFAKVLLIFVAQRYDVHFRKLLWSEHAGALRYCKLQPAQLILPLAEYLKPAETDPSLIETYITALVRDTVIEDQSPIPYLIALHHSAMFLKGESKLATTMRSRIERLLEDDKKSPIAEKLLNYIAPASSVS